MAGVLRGLEALLQQLLAAPLPHQPEQLLLHARALEAFGRVLAAEPSAVLAVVQRVFDLQTKALPLEGTGKEAPPAHPPAGWKAGVNARQKVSGVLAVHAKAAPAALVPHLQAIASQTQQLWDAGLLRPGERCVLSETLVIAAAGSTPDIQKQVVEWVLGPIRAAWTSQDWLRHLATPDAFYARFVSISEAADGRAEAGGGIERQALYHDIHLLERTLRSLAQPAGAPPAEHPISPHLPWMLPVLLQVMQCIHGLAAPHLQAQLARMPAALQMGPKERAVYLGRKVLRGVKVEGAEEEEEEDTLAGVSAYALRTFLRQTRELTYQAVGQVAARVPALWQATTLQPAFVAALTDGLASIDHQMLRLLLRHTVMPLIKHVPADQRQQWLLPVLARLLPHMQQRLTSSWQRQMSPDNGTSSNGTTGRSATEADVVQDRLLREVTREHVDVLAALAEVGNPHPKGGGDSAQAQQASVLDWLMTADFQTAAAAVATATAVMWWPDQAAGSAALICKHVVEYAQREPRLQGWVGTTMLRGGIVAIANSAASYYGAEVLGLLRDILVQQLNSQPGPSQVLLELPHIDTGVLDKFRQALACTPGDKEQRALVKKLLTGVGNEQFNHMLEDWRGAKGTSHQHNGVPSLDAQGADFALTNIFG